MSHITTIIDIITKQKKSRQNSHHVSRWLATHHYDASKTLTQTKIVTMSINHCLLDIAVNALLTFGF